MRRALVAAAVIATLVLVAPLVARALDRTGRATLHQIAESGIKAKIAFVDTGSELNVSGEATGLDPEQAYISLVYDERSVPSGERACAPSDENDLSAAEMLVGAWQVGADGSGTLSSSKSGPTYVELPEIGTMSIRLASTRQLRACGKVHR